MGDEQRYSAATLIDFTASVLQRVGLTEADARLGAAILIDADLMGIDSHGIAHLNTHKGYVPGLKAGTINPRPSLHVRRETAATALLDGDGGFGLIVAQHAMRLAIDKARTAGSGVVAVTDSRHFGAAGYYALMAVPEDMIGLALCNASPWTVPTFGRERMIGTNPIAFAAPAGNEPPFLCDLATSTVAMGQLEIAEREATPIPAGWGLDEQGEPTQDVQRVRHQGGGLTPLGSTPLTSSYKGYALGQMVDILSGVLSGVGFSLLLNRPSSQAGQFFAAFDIAAFRDVAEFKAMMDELQRTFREAPTAPGAARVLLPGQREFETRADRERHGIPLHHTVISMLQALAGELGVEAPPAI